MSNTTIRNRTVFGADCRMQGNMELDNDAAILGRFDGTLKVTGMLDLLESARFDGLLITGSLRLAGKVCADVIASESVELLPGAELRGRLFTPRLTVAEGVVLEAEACIGPSAAAAAEKRLAQIELQNHLEQEEASADAVRHGRADHERGEDRAEEDAEAMPAEAAPTLSIAAHDASEGLEESQVAAPTGSVKSEGEVGGDEGGEVRTMTEAFERILNYRPTKTLRPGSPLQGLPARDAPAA